MNTQTAQNWREVRWQAAVRDARRLQAQLVQAERAGRQRRVFALQDRLTQSRSARLLAVRQVTTNNGKHTPGIDGEIWKTPQQKMRAVELLSDTSYTPQAARRVYIPKDDGGTRPLGILTMRDRAVQALHALALDPIAETRADPHSYGFRKHRCTADAILACAEIFGGDKPPEWVLEADIEACFDTIAHPWLLRHIPLEKTLLQSWLTAGYMEKGRFHRMRRGLPQGGIISPVLTNMTLDGMEAMLLTYFHHSADMRERSKIAFVRYADDFIVAGATKNILQHEAKSLLSNFLNERGMRFSPKKTRLTHISDGFDFLGYHLKRDTRLFGRSAVQITPSRKSLERLLRTVDRAIAERPDADAAQLILVLNPIISGWTRFYAFTRQRDMFTELDRELYTRLRRRVKQRVPHVWQRRERNAYFDAKNQSIPVFLGGHGERITCARQTPRLDYTPIKPECHAYDPAWQTYLEKRQRR